MKERYVVLGGLGFIGSALVQRLANSNAEVVVFDKSSRVSEKRQSGSYRNVDVFAAETSSDPIILDSLCKGDIVFDLWNHGGPFLGDALMSEHLEASVLSSVRMLEEAAKAKVARVVFASSGGSIYGKTARAAVSEKHFLRPISAYGLAKATIERYLEFIHLSSDLDYVVLRLGNVYGPGGERNPQRNIIGNLCASAVEGKPVEIWGDGSIVRDYVYISDVIDALTIGAEYNAPQRIFNIGTGIGSNILRVIQLVERGSGTKLSIRHERARRYDVDFNVLNCERAARVLGWTPKIDLANGIQLTWQSMIGLNKRVAGEK